LANYPLLLNKVYIMHTVLVIMDVSYGRYQIVTLRVAWRKSLRRVCTGCRVFRFRLTVFRRQFNIYYYKSCGAWVDVVSIC